jgi:hypothetical protein
VQGRERDAGEAHHPAGGRLGRAKSLQGEPEQERVELHQLRERPPGPLVRENLGDQVLPQPGRAVPLVGGEREPGDPGAGERAERLAGGCARFWRRRGGPLGILGQDREVERPLAGEIRVDRATGELGTLGDAVDLGVTEAALGELLPRGGQPTAVICELVGIPEGDRPRWREYGAAVAAGWGQRFAEAIPGIVEGAKAAVARRRVEPGDDLIADLISIQAEDKDRLSEAEMVTLVWHLDLAGQVPQTSSPTPWRPCSPTPSSSPRSATDRTSASGPRWAASRPRSRSPDCCAASPLSRSPCLPTRLGASPTPAPGAWPHCP